METYIKRATATSDVGAARIVGALAAIAQETRLAIFRLLIEYAPDPCATMVPVSEPPSPQSMVAV